MAASSLSAFKDLVDTIEKSRNLIEENELLSDEELNTLKQTSSLVAKFQREALAEKENRVSAELLAKEKERLVSDAWKIVSALKKDKYALEFQLERLKSNKPVEKRLSSKRLSAEHKDKQIMKPSPKIKNTCQTNSKEQPQPESGNNTELSSDALKTSNSNDSKEKEDSLKESVDEDLPCDKHPRSEHTRGNRVQELYSAGTEDEDLDVEVEEISSDNASHTRGNRYCSPSEIIKLWAAKPYVSRKRDESDENVTAQERSWYERKDGLKKYSERARDFHARLQNYKPHSRDSFGKSNYEHLKNLEEHATPSLSGEEISSSENPARNNALTSSRYHGDEAITSSTYSYDSTTFDVEESNKASRSEPVRKRLGNQSTGLNTRDHEMYGRHAPKKTSPLVSHSLSTSNEVRPKGVRRSRDYINLVDSQPQENTTSGKHNKTGIRKQEKAGVKQLPKTDSHTRLIISPKGLPGGIVSKRIQDLARRLKIGHSTATSKKNTEGIPYPDDMNLRNPCPGLCGLENLGNSCFMNAGLQCLFVIKPFYRFFLEGGHLDLLKHKSKNQQSNSLSILLGRLIEKVYSGCYLTCEPSALFTCLQSMFPQLDAFRQHDCQEFLALFLDALHQELNTANRNTRRSFKQIESKHVRSADHWWRMYNEEHESVIVDTFQGQFRNKVTCSECGHVSVTYQLFSFLSLPLVSQKMQSFVITLIPQTGPGLTNTSKPKALRLRVQATKPSSTSQIKQRLISLLPEDERPNFNNLFLAVVRDCSIVGLLHDDRIVTPFNDKHTRLYAYEPLLPPVIDSDMNVHLNNATTPIQSHESSRQHIRDKNTLLVPLGNIDDTDGTHGRGGRTRASLPVGYHLTFTCSICLQAKLSKELLHHDECGKVYCRECLQVSSEEENVRCPDCTRPSSTGRKKELNMKYINVPVMFRAKEPDSEDECTLFGHPNLVTLPYKITGEDLYQHLTVLLPVLSVNKKTRATQTLPFTLHLVNYQGRYCSRCDRTSGCTGCCLETDDILVFQNGDHIAVQLTNIIQLEIDKMSRFCDHESMRIKHLTCRLQLQDCLRSFVDREELQDLWSCPECNRERSATKSMSVVRYPDTLIIHLKRYSQSNMKIFTPVEFPLEDLDMGEFMHSINSPRESFSTGDNIYDLMGCVCHDGDFEGGHYTAYTRHGIKAEWCLFDDYKVTKEYPSSSSYKKVYLLFYNRRTDSPLCTSLDETLTPTNLSSKTYDRRHSLEDKYKRVKPRTMKSLSSINEKNASEMVAQTSQHPLKDVVDSNSTSTPKEKLKKQNRSHEKTEGVTINTIQQQEKVNGVTINISRKQEEPQSVTVTIDRQQKEPQRDNSNTDLGKRRQHHPQEMPDCVITDINGQEEPSAQCDCSQCDYFRKLEEQIKRCRRSISGTMTKEMSGEFGSVTSKGESPSTTRETTSKQTTPVKVTKHVKKGCDTRIYKLPGKSPPLASSDSIDSELDDQGSHSNNQIRRDQYHRQSKYSPTSTSSDPITDIDADAEGSSGNARKKKGSGGYHTVGNTDADTGSTRGHKKPSNSRAPYKKGDNEIEADNQRRRSSSSVHYREYETDDKEDDDTRNIRRRSSSWVDVTEEDIDNESLITKTTQMTDSAVQCTLLNEHDMEYGPDYESYTSNISRSNKNKVNSGIQVSINKPRNKQRKSRDNQTSDQNLDEEELEFVTRKLIFAVENEDIRYTLQLLKEGADPSLLIDGVSALHLSAGMISSLGFHFTRLFLECGADPNVKSTDGVTPVHVAAMWGQTECLKLLLSKGGNPYSEDTEGRNAVELARVFENDTSANTSEYLSRLDEHYSSLIHSETLSNVSLTSAISTSKLQYMPYLYEQEDCRPRRTRKQLAELIIPKPEMNTEGSVVPSCGSWTRRFRKRVKKNKLVRTVSGNLRRTSSRLAGRFRSIGDRFSGSSDRQRQTYTDDTDSDT